MRYRITAKQSGASRKTAATGTKSGGGSYLNVTGFPFPLGPLTKRQTIRREVCVYDNIESSSVEHKIISMVPHAD